MKKSVKKHIKIIIIIFAIFGIPSLISFNLEKRIQIFINPGLDKYLLPNNSINASLEFQQRQQTYLDTSNSSNGLNAQATRAYLGLTIYEPVIQETLEKVNSREDTSDFDMNTLLRIMYFNNITGVLSVSLESQIKDAILNFKYWFTEPNEDNMRMWTENHMILFHTAELLAGQLYDNETFPNSGMNGTDHINHALPLVNRWIDWKARFGFSEWHSNIYFNYDIIALLNLVEFAQDNDTATKAAMLVDLIGFDFANNFYKGRYATTHGRTEDNRQMGTSIYDLPRENPGETAWVMLGIGNHDPAVTNNGASVFLATSEKYAPPPILEDIAANATLHNEHKERSSIDIEDGPSCGIGYTSEDDLMFWWQMSVRAASPIMEPSLALAEEYDLDLDLIYNDELLVDLLKFGATIYGTSLNGVCEKVKAVTQGVSLEAVNTYTYRTPHYQLSGAQDHQKGFAGLQEHIWQASLDDYAIVYTCSPGGISDQEFTGGWKPRTTLYKNVGIIQYDRLAQPLLLELVFIYLGLKSYNLAYFPRWAFDVVMKQGKWTFGARGDGYVALYSFEPTSWKSNHELRAFGKKNTWIVELGSIEEYGSFQNFTSSILSSKIKIIPKSVGFSVQYNSPLQGKIEVAWDGPMKVNGQEVDLGDYPRYDNNYCYQEFNTMKTIIQFENQTLELHFDNATRLYYET
ncbi:MAG: hypothetical protein ACFFD5_09395 [Candidatus Thorarchaeota archaeon]